MRPEESPEETLRRIAKSGVEYQDWSKLDEIADDIARRAKLAELGERVLAILREDQMIDPIDGSLRSWPMAMSVKGQAIAHAARSLGLFESEAKPDLRQCSSCREWVAEELSLHRGLCPSCVAACEHPSEGLK